MEISNYFGLEDYIGSLLDVVLFVVIVFIYLKVKKHLPTNTDSWVRPFKSCLAMVILAMLVPLVSSTLAFFVLGDLAEKYMGVLLLLSFYPPIIAATYFAFRMVKCIQTNA